MQVWLLDGREIRLLIHTEVQARTEDEFAQRMYVYHYRIFDRYNQQVISLAVLADERPDWRPARFGHDLAGCRLEFTFPIVKLLDFASHRGMLEANPNPFATVVLAHLATQETRGDPPSRHSWKLRLFRGLYERDLSRDDVLQLFNVIDWMMELPSGLEQLFKSEAEEIEREKHMPYITSIERIARAEGKAEMLLQALSRRFQTAVPEDLVNRIQVTTDPAQLDRWLDLVFESGNLEEFQQKMQA